MAAPTIERDTFVQRLATLHAAWTDQRWNDSSSLLILSGKSGDTRVRKTEALQLWLLGFEFPDTAMLLTASALFVVTSSRKLEMMRPLQGADLAVPLTLLQRSKADADAANWAQLVAAAGATVGHLSKDSHEGSFAASCAAAFAAAEGVAMADVARGVSGVLATRSAADVEAARKAAKLSARAMRKLFKEEMEAIIDEERPTSHVALARHVDERMEGGARLGVSGDDQENVELGLGTIVQSGGNYDARATAQNRDSPLKHDVIVAALAMRYKSQAAMVARTFFIDPPKRVRQAYKAALAAQQACIDALRPGATLKRVHEAGLAALRRSDAALVDHAGKNFGAATGIELRDSALSISATNSSRVSAGMAFCVSVAFQAVPLSAAERADGGKGDSANLETFSIWLADTVLVTDSGCELLAELSSRWTDVSYALGGDSDGEDGESGDDGAEESKTEAAEPSRRQKRQAAASAAQANEARIEKHQAELVRRKQEEHARRAREGVAARDAAQAALARQVRPIVAYEDATMIPSDAPSNQIYVDKTQSAVLLPINGELVPFHISTIKSVQTPPPEGRASFLRIVFYNPGTAAGKTVSPSMNAALQEWGSQAQFLRELTFRSLDQQQLKKAQRQIAELQKRVRAVEEQAAEQAELVKQAKLVRNRQGRVPRLTDLSMTPQISGRKSQGTLEAHTNGFRFTSIKGEHVDVLYSNIKHAIFQPCERELIVLIHFYLKDHIMIGKKKHKNVQFFTEVMDASQALDSRNNSAYDPDELDEEQRERTLRNNLNESFKKFCADVQAQTESLASNEALTWEIPFSELAFMGTPNKEMVRLQPSVNCLVNLTERPVFVVSLDEIEHVHFERVIFSAKNFDMVIVMKDFNHVPHRISAIPISSLDAIKEWLDDIDMVFTAGPANLNWKEIMRAVREDERFFLDTDQDGNKKDAGWEFLRMEGHSDDSEAGSGSESNFSDDEAAVESEESESDEEDWDVDESDSDEPVSEDEEMDEPSWEELERQAREDDDRRGEPGSKRRHDDEEDSAPRKKKAKKAGKR